MKTLQELLIYEYYDCLGHNLKVGDFIQFEVAKLRVYGQIQEITDEESPKYVVKTLGFFGDKNLREKVKDQYKVKVDKKNIFQVSFKNKESEDKLRKDGIII